MFLLTVTTFCSSYLNFLLTSLTAVIQIALFTTLFLTPSVFNFLTALLLLQISASLSTVIVNTILSLDGMMQLIPSNRLLAFGIKFGLNEVAPRPLVFIPDQKNSLRRFKYEVRRLHRRQCHIRREYLANALSHSSSQESWKQISKSSSGSSNSSTANIVDGCCDDGEISNIFSSKLKSLLNFCPDPQSCNNLYSSTKEYISVLPISLLFSSLRRLFVMPYHNLNLASVMTQCVCPTTSSMPKMP